MLGNNFPMTAKEINNGYCADFATVVWEELGYPDELNFHNDEELADVDYSHTFLEYNGMYYDAECIEGIDDWTQLPSFTNEL